MKKLMSLRVLFQLVFWLVGLLSLRFSPVAFAQSSGLSQSVIGLPFPSQERSPGGIPLVDQSTSTVEYLIPGSTIDHPFSPFGANDRAVLWLDANGDLSDSKLYSTSSFESMAWMEAADDNTIYLAGTENNEMTLTKINHTGIIYWVGKIGTPNLTEKGVCVKINNTGGPILLGIQETTPTQHSVVLVNRAGNGNELWNKVYTLQGWSLEASSLATLNCLGETRFYVTGKMTPVAGGQSRVFLMVVDAVSGLPIQMNYYNIIQNGSDYGTCVQAICGHPAARRIWISGYSYAQATGKYLLMMLKTDDLGNLEWGFNYDIENGDEFARHFIVSGPDEKLIVTGKAECHEFGTGEYPGYGMLTSINNDGLSANWVRTYRWTSDFLRFSEGFRVEQRPGGVNEGFFVTGVTESNGDRDILSILTDANGETTDECNHDTTIQVVSSGTTAYPVDTSLFIENSLAPYEYSDLDTLHFDNKQAFCARIVDIKDIPTGNTFPFRIYPNPANDLIYVEWTGDTPREGWVSITTSSGKLVRLLALNSAQRMEIQLGSLPAGLYFINVRSEHQWFKPARIYIE
jgi:hypothetical protein